MQVWNAGSFKSAPPRFQAPDHAIDVYFNFDLVKSCRSKADALKLITQLLADAPVNLEEFEPYLKAVLHG